MKKIMIAAAVVGLAAFAQAASFDWSTKANFVKLHDGTSNIKPQSTVYLFQTDVAGDKGYDAFIAALTADDFDTSKITQWDCFAGTLTTKDTTKTRSTGEGSGSANVKATTSLGEYEGHQFVALILDKDASGTEYYNLSSATGGKAKDPNDPTDTSVNPEFTSAFFKGGWQEITKSGSDTPEPTSAMLLLLGVAGLALRRKAK